MKRRNLSPAIILGTALIIAGCKMGENWMLFVGLLFMAMVVLLQFD
jgi:hypothetical protein